MHCRTVDNTFHVRRVEKIIDLPEFSPLPVDIGRFEHYQPAPFDWTAYRDIDDRYYVEEFESVEEQAERLEQAAAATAEKERLAKAEQKKNSRKKNQIMTNEDGSGGDDPDTVEIDEDIGGGEAGEEEEVENDVDNDVETHVANEIEAKDDDDDDVVDNDVIEEVMEVGTGQ
jgi:hypothetical protein